jgi:hypothetical protein
MSDHSLLTTALVAAQIPDSVPEASMVRSWRYSWSGVGQAVEAMQDLGYDVHPLHSRFVWWAEFCRGKSTPCRGGSGRVAARRPGAPSTRPSIR